MMRGVSGATGKPSGGGRPRTIRVVGRPVERENSDVCGEYQYAGVLLGHAVYQKRGSPMAIRYWAPMKRWVIDREGVRESDVCVAYADNLVGAEDPAHPELIWHIWSATAGAHLEDTEVVALDAPGTVALVGRGPGRENSVVNGEYELSGVCHGRPLYQHQLGSAVLRYHAPEGRWLLSAPSEAGNVCSAFAEGAGAQHPGLAALEWQFWEPQRGAFALDPAARCLAAPSKLHVIGRRPEAENARICGTYHVVGAFDGRPLYVQPGTHHVIRYSAKHDWWLIDCDGLAEPSLASKLYHWILSGDPAAASERCSAYAQAHGTAHPGHPSLEWQVWETRAGRHVLDPWVRGTTAPLAVQVRGRRPGRENGDIAGDYVLAGTHSGRAAYQKPGERTAIRFWAPMGRWVIDREGLRNSDTCVAFGEGPEDADHPAVPGHLWHVWETSRGLHLADPSVTVTIPRDAPKELQPRLPPSVTCSNNKRGSSAATMADPKRRRLETLVGGGDSAALGISAQERGVLPSQLAARLSGSARWFGLFGA